MRIVKRLVAATGLAWLSCTVIPAQSADLSDLGRRYLERDLSLSTIEELAARARQLKLSDQGTKDELIARLREYYAKSAPASDSDKSAPAPKKPEEATDMTVTIESAGSAQYLTVEQVKEQYIKLSGGVVLSINDPKNKVTHRIKADEIMYNKQKEAMTARGNVEYKLTEAGKDQTFTGQEMSFSLPNSDGIFLDGAMSRNQTVKGSSLTFTIRGSKISRNDHNLVVMDDAQMTSSTWTPPNYQINAKKIWILKPGEWALNDAVLYVGRVPVFYFPFFFYPSDEMIFHPVAGYKTLEGGFLQTTTYLIGVKPANSSSISFMQIDSGQTGETDQRVHGAFIEKVPKKTPGAVNAVSGQYLKVLVDLYTNLGYFAGVQADLKSTQVPTLNLLGGIGFSKALFSGVGLGYTSIGQSGAEYWDQGFLGGIRVPFRFILNIDTSIQLEDFSLSLNFPLASDPFIRRDFLTNRAEDIDWGKLIGFTKDTTQTNTNGLATANDTMNMNLSMTANFKTPFFGQWLPVIKLKKFNLALGWSALSWKNSPISGEPTLYRSANTSFYVPGLLTLPDIALNLSGTIFQYPPASGKPNQPALDPQQSAVAKDIMPPWELPEDQNKPDPATNPAATADDQALRVPSRPQSQAASGPASSDISASIGYSIDPGLVLESRFNSSGVTSPTTLQSKMDYLNLKYALASRLNYNLNLPANWLVYSGYFSFTKNDGVMLQRPGPSDYPDAVSVLTAFASYPLLNISNSNTLEIFPFRSLSAIADSSLKYGIDYILYRTRYTGFDNTTNLGIYATDTIDWVPAMVTNHYASLNFNLNLAPFQLALTGQYNLPPQIPSLNLTSRLGFWTGSLSASELIQFGAANGNTNFGPINLALSLPFTTWLSSTSTMVIDPNANNVSSASSQLQFYGLSLQVNALQSFLRYYTEPIGWNDTGTKDLRVKTASIGYKIDWKSDPFWKNRITTGINANLSYSQDFIEITNSTLNYSLNWVLNIYQFLDFSITVNGANTRMYRYFHGFNQMVGTTDRNFFEDLFQSFWFFQEGQTARYSSFFKMTSISLSLTHYLGDWQLALSYTGTPVLRSSVSTWDNTLNVSIAWKPIPEIATTVNSYNDVLTVR